MPGIVHMNKLTATLAVALVLLAGCGRQEQTASQQPPAAAPAVPAAPAAAAPARAAPAPADAAAVAAAAEDGESVDEVTVDVSPIAAAVAANTPGPAAPAAFRWKEGQHFNPLPLTQPTSVAAGNVEVTEIFWYGCGHCYSLETQLDNWDKKLRPGYVQLNRLPVVWNPVTREDARLYYTLEALGRQRDLHTLVFREIHVNRNPFTIVQGQTVDQAATERRVREFLTKNGVGEADIARTYRSFATENRLRQAENLSRRYLADHTPMVIVNGKYTADVTSAGGPDQLFQLINDLAARERGTR
jgi:protein dithiol oxidoreductase (disulfide-forming)